MLATFLDVFQIESKPKTNKIETMNTKILYLFTRTPLHVGAGSSVGAIDQPIIRERHTGFPVIPASSLKGTFADAWNDELMEENEGKIKKVRVKKDGNANEPAWLFGSDNADYSFAGSLQFSEARLLAFPVRSAKGSFAWITCPLLLRRALRDGVFKELPNLPRLSDEQAIFLTGGPLAIGDKIVLEEYTFTKAGDLEIKIGDALSGLLKNSDGDVDPVWSEVASRIVILSDGMMSFFAQNACDVAQHVRIDDETGTAAEGALFNQENVPSETLFYCLLHAFPGRGKSFKDKKPEDAVDAFKRKLEKEKNVFQFGGDASTGLGWCTVRIADPAYNIN